MKIEFNKEICECIDKNMANKIVISILTILVFMFLGSCITTFILKLSISSNNVESISNILVVCIELITLPISLGAMICLYWNRSVGLKLLRESFVAVCMTLSIGIIVSMLPPIVENSIRVDERISYDKEQIILETISAYEKQCIVEETQKALKDKDYKSAFIKNKNVSIEAVRNDIKEDVKKRINE